MSASGARPWTPEVELDALTAAQLIRTQFPELQVHDVQLLGRGWDNAAFLINHNLVFRFPQQAAAVTLLETEASVLPALAGRLPLEVPKPDWQGQPSTAFPWMFLGHRLVPGRPASQARLSDAERVEAAPRLAGFLARLHAIDPAQLHVPGDLLNRRDFLSRLPLMVERLERLRAENIIADAAPWLRLFTDLQYAPPAGPDTLVHGDLYARHLLVDADRRLTGIIDWGDVHAGDVAMDLMLVFGFLPASARHSFFHEYGPVKDVVLRTARLRAAFHTVSVTWYGLELREQDLLDEGHTAMRFVLED